MTELVAESFAALAAGCGVAGIVLAVPRNRAPEEGSARRCPIPVDGRLRGDRRGCARSEGADRAPRSAPRYPDPPARRCSRRCPPPASDGCGASAVARSARRGIRRGPVRGGGLRRSVSALRGPLGEELERSLDSVDLGARWRDELAAVTERLSLPDLRRAVAVLTRTETLGTSLTSATRELAADVRSSRRAAVAERARAAPVKMLFPLVFLVLPAFLLLTVVPVLLTTVRSIR